MPSLIERLDRYSEKDLLNAQKAVEIATLLRRLPDTREIDELPCSPKTDLNCQPDAVLSQSDIVAIGDLEKGEKFFRLLSVSDDICAELAEKGYPLAQWRMSLLTTDLAYKTHVLEQLSQNKLASDDLKAKAAWQLDFARFQKKNPHANRGDFEKHKAAEQMNFIRKMQEENTRKINNLNKSYPGTTPERQALNVRALVLLRKSRIQGINFMCEHHFARSICFNELVKMKPLYENTRLCDQDRAILADHDSPFNQNLYHCTLNELHQLADKNIPMADLIFGVKLIHSEYPPYGIYFLKRAVLTPFSGTKIRDLALDTYNEYKKQHTHE